MKKKVVKKSSSPKKTAVKKKTIKRNSSAKKRSALKKKLVKKKPVTRKKNAPKKKLVKKKPVTRKKNAPKKKTVKKRPSTRKKNAPKKKVVKKRPATRKKNAPKKKTVKKRPATRKKSAPKKKVTKRAKASTKSRRARSSNKYMNANQLKHFHSILLSRKEELIAEVNRTAEYIQTGSNTYADAIDQASQEEEFTLQLKERDRESKLLQKINEALAKIDNKEYGFCVSCGAEIGIDRLEARPTTDQCIDCKQLEEIKERHF